MTCSIVHYKQRGVSLGCLICSMTPEVALYVTVKHRLTAETDQMQRINLSEGINNVPFHFM